MAVKSLRKAIDSIIIEETNNKLNEIGNFLKNENIKLSPTEIDQAIEDFRKLNVNVKGKDKKTRSPTAYQNYVRMKMPEYKNSGKNGRENMSAIAKEWMGLEASEKIKYNSDSKENEIKSNKKTRKST